MKVGGARSNTGINIQEEFLVNAIAKKEKKQGIKKGKRKKEKKQGGFKKK